MTSNEIAETMSEKDARLVTGHMRNIIASVTEKLDDFVKMATAMYERRGWDALGYESWDDYVAAELRTDKLSLERGARRELIAQLRSAGMSTRAIGAAVGVSDETARQDIKASGAKNLAPVTGTDGKTYPSSPPVRDEPLLHGEGERRTVPAGSDTPGAQDELPDVGATRPVEDQGAPAPSVTPSPEALARHERERAAQVSRQTATDNLAKSVWLIAGQAEMDEPVDRIISDWLPEHDIYPKPTTAERLKTAADYLFALSERWPW